jgi:hypothetical protein
MGGTQEFQGVRPEYFQLHECITFADDEVEGAVECP